MLKNITKNLIILCAVIFTFAALGVSSAQACFGYNCEYRDVVNYNDANYNQYSYNSNGNTANPYQYSQNQYSNQAYSQYNGYYQQPTTGYYNSYPQQQTTGYYNSYPQQVAQPQPIIVYATNPTTTTTTPVVQTPKPVVNNYYYYQTDPNAYRTVTTTVNNPIPVPKTTTNTTNTTTNYTNIPDTTANPYNYNTSTNPYNYNNGLGATAYTGYNQVYTQPTGNGIAALTFRGTGGFLPSSIWQWMLVVILILAIIVIARTFVRKPSPADHTEHTVHVH